MAGARRTDLLGRLADMSEEAIQRLGEVPGAEKVLGTINTLRDRTDELQKRVRGLENLESRLEALERKVDKLSKRDGEASSAPRKSTKTTSSKATGTKSSTDSTTPKT